MSVQWWWWISWNIQKKMASLVRDGDYCKLQKDMALKTMQALNKNEDDFTCTEYKQLNKH